MNKQKKKSLLENPRIGFYYALPAIIGVSIFAILPMILSLFLAFTDFTGTNSPHFVGLDNFARMFNGEDEYFLQSLKVTFVYTVFAVPIHLTFAFLIAMLMNQKIRGLGFFRTIFYLPCLVPMMATAAIWMWLFQPEMGLLNVLLNAVGLPSSQWIHAKETVLPSLIFMGLWGVGGTMLIFLASLQDVPRELYEAAEIDGANSWTRLIKITLPFMSPVIFYNLIMAVIGALQVFAQPMVMTGGGPDNASLFFGLHLYNEVFGSMRYGYGSAMALFMFAVIALCSLLMFRTSNFWVMAQGDDDK